MLIFMIILILGIRMDAFKILVLNPWPSYSHQRPINALIERLVEDGHQLFVVSPNKIPGLENHVNYSIADLSYVYQEKENSKQAKTLYQDGRLSKWDLPTVIASCLGILKREFQSQPFLEFKRRLDSENIKFDVSIVNSAISPFLTPMARVLAGDAPIIGFSSFVMDWSSEDLLGSTVHLSFAPSLFSHFTDKMTLLQKLENWFVHHYVVSNLRRCMEAFAREFIRENYGEMNESLVDAWWTRVSLTLISSNSLYYHPRQLGPNVIEVGPLHLKPPGELPKDIKDWLDGAKGGVIYFSFGSNIKSKSLPQTVLDNFLSVFRELPAGYRVLWKWEADGKIPGQPDNILTQKWMPQDSVLAHPKVRLFITQGGLQSFQEAVHYGVPTVVTPWLFDQECVAAKMVDAKIGVKLSPQNVHSYEKVKSAIETVLYNESYSRNMRRLSSVSHDFTSGAMDKAVFFVEHVASHGGASHLRPSSAHASFFEYFCLDIISVILVLCSVLLCLTFYILRFSIKYLPLVSIKFGKKMKDA